VVQVRALLGSENTEQREAIADEIADVALYLLALCNTLNLDLSEAIRSKLVKTARKYPVERVRGKYRMDEA